VVSLLRRILDRLAEVGGESSRGGEALYADGAKKLAPPGDGEDLPACRLQLRLHLRCRPSKSHIQLGLDVGKRPAGGAGEREEAHVEHGQAFGGAGGREEHLKEAVVGDPGEILGPSNLREFLRHPQHVPIHALRQPRGGQVAPPEALRHGEERDEVTQGRRAVLGARVFVADEVLEFLVNLLLQLGVGLAEGQEEVVLVQEMQWWVQVRRE